MKYFLVLLFLAASSTSLRPFGKKVQVNGFATQFDEQPDFHKFVKSTLALSYLPLVDIEKGLEYLKASEENASF